MKNQYYHNSNINSNSNRQPYNNNNYNNNSYNANSYNTQDNPNTKLYSPENSEVEGVQPKKVPAKKANHLTIEEVNYSHGKAVDSPVSMTTEELKSSSDTPTKESSFSKFSANSAFRSVEISSEKVNNRTNNGDINTNRTKNKKKSDRFSLTPGPKYGSSDDNDSRKRGITPSELSSKSPIAFNLFDDRSKVYWQNRLSPEKNINFQDSSVSPDVYNMLNQALGKQSMNNTYGSILDQVDLSQSVNDRLDDHLVNEWNRMKPEVAAAAAAAAFDPDHTFLVAGIGKRRVIQANIPEVPLGQSPPRPGQYYNQIYGASPSSHRTNTGALSSITSPHSSITDGYFATSSQDSFAVTSRSNDGMQFPNAFPNSPYKNYPPSGRGRSSPHMVHANSDSVMHFGQNRNKNNLTRHSFNITELHHNGFNGNMHGEMDNFHSYEYHHGEDLDPNLVASQYYMNNNLPGYPNQPDSRRAVEIDHNIPVAQPFYNLQLGKANGMMGQGYDPTTRNFSPNVNSKYKQHHRSDESDQKVAMHKYHQFSNAHENYGHGAFEPKFQRHHSGIYRSGDESAGSKGQNAGKRRNNGHHSADSDSSGTYSAKSLKAKMKADQQKHSKEVKPVVATKPELVESPRSKHAYKEFFKEFRNKEKDSVDDAVDYGIKTLETITDNAKWRVYLELADISKRNHDLDTVRLSYL